MRGRQAGVTQFLLDVLIRYAGGCVGYLNAKKLGMFVKQWKYTKRQKKKKPPILFPRDDDSSTSNLPLQDAHAMPRFVLHSAPKFSTSIFAYLKLLYIYTTQGPALLPTSPKAHENSRVSIKPLRQRKNSAPLPLITRPAQQARLWDHDRVEAGD